jgi:hypothetical protein
VVAIVLSCVRVASAPSSAEPVPHRTVKSATDEVRTEVQATVVGLRRERAYWEGHLNRMAADMGVLEERLSERSMTQGTN